LTKSGHAFKTHAGDLSAIGIYRQLKNEASTKSPRDDVAYIYYWSLETLKAPADLIKFLGPLTGEMPEDAEPPAGNEWCKEPI
jgi:hypothetical protein